MDSPQCRGRRQRSVFTLGILALGIYQGVILFRVIRLRHRDPESTAFIDQRHREVTAQGKVFQFQRAWIPYDRISPHLLHGVVAAEDPRFWRHPGFDPKAMWKAARVDWKARRIVYGASTVDQQLAKNLFFSPSKSPVRKVQEIIVAVEMEIFLPKRRILEIYLNVIEWGDGVYGAEAAAQHYFQTSASSLNLEQAAYLTAIIPGPHGDYNPLEYPRRVQTRANDIVKQIKPCHFEGRVSLNLDAAYEPAYEFGVPCSITWE